MKLLDIYFLSDVRGSRTFILLDVLSLSIERIENGLINWLIDSKNDAIVNVNDDSDYESVDECENDDDSGYGSDDDDDMTFAGEDIIAATYKREE